MIPLVWIRTERGFRATRDAQQAALAPNLARYACLDRGFHEDGEYACPRCGTPFPPV